MVSGTVHCMGTTAPQDADAENSMHRQLPGMLILMRGTSLLMMSFIESPNPL